jgi:hypothetical protein
LQTPDLAIMTVSPHPPGRTISRHRYLNEFSD